MLLFIQLLYYNNHLGHKIINTSLMSSWFLFRLQKNIWLINIFKTIFFLKQIFLFIKWVIIKNKSIWFINMDNSKQNIIHEYALSCGEFSITTIWKRGLFSNYKSIFNTIKKFMHYEEAYKDHRLYHFYIKWYITRYTWPRGIFISNLGNFNIIAKEARSMFIPIINIVDTDMKYFYSNLPIPSNNDSLESITLISSIISKYILKYKYRKLIIWLIYYRNKLNLNKIIKLLNNFNNLIILKKQNYLNFNFVNFNYSTILEKGLNVLFLKKWDIKKSNINIINMLWLNDKIFNKLYYYSDIIKLSLYKKKFYKKKSLYKKLHKIYYIINFFRFEKKKKYMLYFWFFFSIFIYFFRSFRILFETFDYTKFSSLVKILFDIKADKAEYDQMKYNQNKYNQNKYNQNKYNQNKYNQNKYNQNKYNQNNDSNYYLKRYKKIRFFKSKQSWRNQKPKNISFSNEFLMFTAESKAVNYTNIVLKQLYLNLLWKGLILNIIKLNASYGYY